MEVCRVGYRRRLSGLGLGGGGTTNPHAAPYCDMINEKVVDWERERTKELEMKPRGARASASLVETQPKGPKGPVARSFGGAPVLPKRTSVTGPSK